MKWFLLLLIFVNTSKIDRTVETVYGGELPLVEVKCGCTIPTTFTTYKVGEKLNKTRYLLNNIKVKDTYNVPNVIALGGKTRQYFNIGDTVRFLIRGKIYKRIYLDKMSNVGKWKTHNYNRNDLLINEDESFYKIEGHILLP